MDQKLIDDNTSNCEVVKVMSKYIKFILLYSSNKLYINYTYTTYLDKKCIKIKK